MSARRARARLRPWFAVLAIGAAALLAPSTSFAAAGDLDPTFGDGGKTLAAFGCTNTAIASAVALYEVAGHPAGLIVGGQCNDSFAVARLDGAGHLDTSFGGGLVQTSFAGGGTGSVAD